MTTGKAIWIVNHYAGSPVHGMEYRHYYLAQQFRQMGLRPVIFCASFHHLLTKLPEDPCVLAEMLRRIAGMPGTIFEKWASGAANTCDARIPMRCRPASMRASSDVTGREGCDADVTLALAQTCLARTRHGVQP